MSAIWAIFQKEIKDALRDRRTLLVAVLGSLLGAPLMLFVFSTVMSQVESQVEKRTVMAVGMQHAPRLDNFILRQGFQITTAPADYEAKTRSKELSEPVLLVADDFEVKLARGEKASLEISYDTSNRQSEFGLRPLKQLLEGYVQETAVMGLLMRGISPEILQLIEVKERHLSRPEERKASITTMLPILLLTAIILGGMYASIDTTAGERERGSLEPLMMNPISGWQFTIGKWAAVAAVNMGVVGLTVLSFFPSKLLIRNDALRAEFQFGATDAMGFMLILLPLAATVAALLIAIAIDCKTYKEGQVRCSMLSIVLPLLGMTPIFFPGREPAWFQWVPVLAQTQMMNQVLKGEVVTPTAIAIALGVCLMLIVMCLWYVAQKMRRVVMV